MKPEVKSVAYSLRDILNEYSDLSFIQNKYMGENIVDLLSRSEYPLLNIEIGRNTPQLVGADNMNDNFVVRYKYTFHIQYAVRSESRNIALFGSESLKGIYDICDLVHECLVKSRTLGGSVWDMEIVTTGSQVFSPEPDKLYFIAGAETVVNYWKDVNL